jgi:Kef-type K+ transport system membrane component KefB
VPTLLASAAPGLPGLLVGLAVVLLAARAGGLAFERLGQPAVLGELAAGIVLGNLALVGVPVPDLHGDPVLALLAEIGILLLLFEIGVEATVPQMLRVGPSALLVGLVGVVAPAALGFLVARGFFPEASPYMHVFAGAVLCATSVGVTARVLKDLGRTRTREARLVLGAAVIDDVLGLVALATVTAAIEASEGGAPLGVGAAAWITAKAFLFLGVTVSLGHLLAPRVFRWAAHVRGRDLMLPLTLAFCFLLSFLAHAAGLAPIVGAFTAGLVLEEGHFRALAARERMTVGEMLRPLTTFLLPIFFVLIGARVDLSALASPVVLAFSGALLAAAVIGKLACAAGVLTPGVDRWAVALAMVPRGEVGFVFAGIGTTVVLEGSPVLAPGPFAALVLAVMGTTLVAPPFIARRFRRIPVPAGEPESPDEGFTALADPDHQVGPRDRPPRR